MGENPVGIPHRMKGLSPYYSSFLPYILIPIKNNESKVVKIFRKTIF
jgi:hypothetical protein